MVLAALIALYSVAGGIVLFMYGQFLYFTYPEPQLYGGIAMAVAAISVITILCLSNSSYMFARLLFYLGPFIIVVSAIRAGVMVFRLNQHKDNVVWECNHGGQLYNSTLANDPNYVFTSTDSTVLPGGFCSSGFNTLYTAVAVALVIDLVLQIYQWFMIWRFKARLEGYFAFTNRNGGIYTA